MRKYMIIFHTIVGIHEIAPGYVESDVFLEDNSGTLQKALQEKEARNPEFDLTDSIGNIRYYMKMDLFLYHKN